MVCIYNEDNLLPLSGIQHFAYCERQWGLIHVENQWVENLRTAEGRLHQRVDDPYFGITRQCEDSAISPLLSKSLAFTVWQTLLSFIVIPVTYPAGIV